MFKTRILTMANIKKYITSKWCGILMALLAAMGFNSCHRAEKVAVDGNNNGNMPDTVNIIIPPKRQAPGQVICLYGVPPSKFEKIENQKVKP